MLTELEIELLESFPKRLERIEDQIFYFHKNVMLNIACKSGKLEYVKKFLHFPKSELYEEKSILEYSLNSEVVFAFLRSQDIINSKMIKMEIEKRYEDHNFIVTIFNYYHKIDETFFSLSGISLSGNTHHFLIHKCYFSIELGENFKNYLTFADLNYIKMIEKCFPKSEILKITRNNEVLDHYCDKLSNFSKFNLINFYAKEANPYYYGIDRIICENIDFSVAFSMAIKNSNFYLVKKLIVLIDTSKNNHLVLENAIIRGNFEIFEFLVEFFDINLPRVLRRSLLQEDERFFQTLIRNPKLDTNSESFMRAFAYSLKLNRFCEYFLEFDNFDINICYNFSIMEFINNKSKEFYVKFLSKYRDINMIDSSGKNILTVSIEKDVKVLFDLIVAREDLDINQKNNDGIAPIFYALNSDNPYYYNTLFKLEIDPNVRNSDGKFLLFCMLEKDIINKSIIIGTNFMDENFIDFAKNNFLDIYNKISSKIEFIKCIDEKFSKMEKNDIKYFLYNINLNFRYDCPHYHEIRKLLEKYYWDSLRIKINRFANFMIF